MDNPPRTGKPKKRKNDCAQVTANHHGPDNRTQQHARQREAISGNYPSIERGVRHRDHYIVTDTGMFPVRNSQFVGLGTKHLRQLNSATASRLMTPPATATRINPDGSQIAINSNNLSGNINHAAKTGQERQ